MEARVIGTVFSQCYLSVQQQPCYGHPLSGSLQIPKDLTGGTLSTFQSLRMLAKAVLHNPQGLQFKCFLFDPQAFAFVFLPQGFRHFIKYVRPKSFVGQGPKGHFWAALVKRFILRLRMPMCKSFLTALVSYICSGLLVHQQIFFFFNSQHIG